MIESKNPAPYCSDRKLADLELLCELVPDSAYLHVQCANSLVEVGRRQEASEHVRAAIRLAGTDVRKLMRIGINLQRLGLAAEALTVFESAVGFDPIVADA